MENVNVGYKHVVPRKKKIKKNKKKKMNLIVHVMQSYASTTTKIKIKQI